MVWRVVPTSMWHRMEADVLRHHKDIASKFWRSFEHAWKDIDKEVDRARSFGKGFDRSDGIRHVDKEMNRARSCARRFERSDGIDKEMNRARSFARRFERSDGIRHVKSPFVTDTAGNTKLQVRYDVIGYKPEDITIKMVDNRLVVNARRMKEEAGEKWYSEFTRESEIPKEVETGELKSTLTPDGILQVEAPLKPGMAPKETEIPIEFAKAEPESKTET